MRPAVKKRKDTLVLTPALNYINENYMRKDHRGRTGGDVPPVHNAFPASVFNHHGQQPRTTSSTKPASRAPVRMLQTTDQAVLNIAETVGFVSVSSFNRCFQQMIGVTPRQYRNPEGQDHKPQRPQSIVQYRGWVAPDL